MCSEQRNSKSSLSSNTFHRTSSPANVHVRHLLSTSQRTLVTGTRSDVSLTPRSIPLRQLPPLCYGHPFTTTHNCTACQWNRKTRLDLGGDERVPRNHHHRSGRRGGNVILKKRHPLAVPATDAPSISPVFLFPSFFLRSLRFFHCLREQLEAPGSGLSPIVCNCLPRFNDALFEFVIKFENFRSNWNRLMMICSRYGFSTEREARGRFCNKKTAAFFCGENNIYYGNG